MRPIEKSLLDRLACPPARGNTPSDVAPSKNSTVPVAAPGVTLAVSVTSVPNPAGLLLDTTVVTVGAESTVNATFSEELERKQFSPT